MAVLLILLKFETRVTNVLHVLRLEILSKNIFHREVRLKKGFSILREGRFLSKCKGSKNTSHQTFTFKHEK